MSNCEAEHPLSRAVALDQQQEVRRLLLEERCDPNATYATLVGSQSQLRFPLELALRLPSQSCLRFNVTCSHCDCLFASEDSMLHLLIRLGANINYQNCLITHVLFFGPFRALYIEDPDILSDLGDRLRERGCQEAEWQVLRLLYEKEQFLIFDFVRSCIENGLRCDPRLPGSIAVTRCVAILAAMWLFDPERTLRLQLNLWLCGFTLASPDVDFPSVRAFQLLPSSLQREIRGFMKQAIAFSKAPMHLSLLARSCIRKMVPLETFKSSVLALRLPSRIRRYILYAEFF